MALQSLALFASIIVFSTKLAASDSLDSWGEYPRPAGSGAPNSIAFGNGTFVAVGMNGSILTSTNGADWTKQVSGTTNHLFGVRFVNNYFFTGGNLISSDGVNWTELGTVGAVNGQVLDITYGEGRYHANVSGYYATSTNLTEWEVSGAVIFPHGATLAYGKGRLVAHVTLREQYPPYRTSTAIRYTTDGLQWSSGSLDILWPSMDAFLGPITYEYGLFFVLHGGQASFGSSPDPAMILSYSTDGVSFTNALRFPQSSSVSPKIAAAGGYYVYPVGNRIFYTTNMVPATQPTNPSTNWAQVPLEITLPEAGSTDVAFGNDTFVVVTQGKIFKSNPLTGSVPVRIVKQPASLSLIVGGAGTLAIEVHGTDPISYQWRKDGTNIVGATNSTLILRDVSMASAGEYDVQISNPNGMLFSEMVTVRVNFADIKRYSGITLRGNEGDRFLIEYQDDLDPSEQWTAATNVTLAAKEFIWIDLTSPDEANRYYRATYQDSE